MAVKKPALGERFKDLIAEVERKKPLKRNTKKEQIPKGLGPIYGQFTEAEQKQLQENIINRAINMISNIEHNILVDVNGTTVYNLNTDFTAIQNIIDNVELKRIKSGYGKGRDVIDVNISYTDIRAVLFKPLIELPLSDESLIEGSSVFATWWKIPEETLYENLDEITDLTEIQTAFRLTKTRIDSFRTEVLSFINNPERFIEALLQQVPTAFGEQS